MKNVVTHALAEASDLTTSICLDVASLLMGDEKRCNACSRRSVRLDNLYLSRRGVTTVHNLYVDRAFDPSEGVRLLWSTQTDQR